MTAAIARFNDNAAPVAVDLYEAQPEIGTVGAGITVWPRTRRLLESMGLMDALDGEIGTAEQPHNEKKSGTYLIETVRL